MSHHPERTARNVRPVNQPPSKNKFEIEYFPAAGRVCPVFYGEHNIHRHPCECVVRQIRERRGVVVPVTDTPRTKTEQTLEW